YNNSSFKRRFGDYVRSVTFRAQHAEVTARIILHNLKAILTRLFHRSLTYDQIHKQYNYDNGREPDAPVNPADYRPCDGPEFYGIVAMLFQNQTHPAIVPLHNLLKAGIKPNLDTLTRVIWDPSGDGEIIHQYGLPTQYSLNGKFACPNGRILDPATNAEAYVQAAFNTRDSMHHINHLLQWVSGKKRDAWCLNDKPPVPTESILNIATLSYYDSTIDATYPGIDTTSTLDFFYLGVHVVEKFEIRN
ncbi:hypothetical protein HZB02_03085, partial [Candidatus Woesearchaeota archaeon]|nr:hypothetical protein [Candidatus Woesearchaeota archaeon]